VPLLVAAGLGVAGAAGARRPSAASGSLLRALAATDVAALVRVEAVEPVPTVRVLERLRGPETAARLALGAGPSGCGGLDAPLRAGQTALLLLVRRDGGYDCAPRWRAAHVALDEAERADALRFLRGLDAALGARAEVTPAVRAALRDAVTLPPGPLRDAALLDLASVAEPDEAPFFLALARDRTRPPALRVWALGALAGRPFDPAALAPLLEPAEPVELRAAALQALAARGDAALPELERALRDASPALRRVAIDNLGGPAAVPVLRRHVAQEPEPALQAAAVRRLGQIGGEPAAAALREVLARDLEPGVRAAAEDALAAAEAR